MDRAKKKVIFIDVGITRDHLPSLLRVEKNKVDKYNQLKLDYQNKGYQVDVFGFSLGALGSYYSRNDRVFKELGVQPRKMEEARTAVCSASMTGSHAVWHFFVSNQEQGHINRQWNHVDERFDDRYQMDARARINSRRPDARTHLDVLHSQRRSQENASGANAIPVASTSNRTNSRQTNSRNVPDARQAINRNVSDAREMLSSDNPRRNQNIVSQTWAPSAPIVAEISQPTSTASQPLNATDRQSIDNISSQLQQLLNQVSQIRSQW